MKNEMKDICRQYNYLASELDTAYHNASYVLGLSDSAMRILYTICLGGDCCMLSDIIRLSGISKQTINSALRKLEAEGTVYLETAEGRKKKVCLTEQGKALAQRTVVQLQKMEDKILSSWTPEEQAIYVSLTERYLNDFNRMIKEIAP